MDMVGSMNAPIIIDNVLPLSTMKSAYQYFDPSDLGVWTFNNRSYGKNDPVSWQHPMRDDLIFFECASIIKLKMMRHLKRDLKLCKIHVNGQTAGQNTIFHKDYREDSIWTFIYFNQLSWNQSWGGEFVSQSPNGEYHYVPYVSNTGCFIPSNWEHRGASPNHMTDKLRTTIAFSFCDPSIHAKIISHTKRKWY